MTLRDRFAAALVASLCFVACDDTRTNDAGPPVDSGPQLIDAGPRPDAGPQADGGVDSDAGVDAGPSVEDAGPQVDAGPESDGGPVAQDGGPLPDAGMSSRPGPGDLVLVEMQGNPQQVADVEGEFFELINVSGRTLDLVGVRVTHLDWAGGEPVVSRAEIDVNQSITLVAGGRALFTRSNGGFFGGATPDFVYDEFEFANGGDRQNRIRLMTPTWDGSEPPDAADVIDEVITRIGAFDNIFRGRALQLDPGAVSPPTAAGNDDPDDWCYTSQNAGREYRNLNWGTPGAAEACN